MSNERGQIIIILILVMTVGLAIGLSVIQRSLSDISTSTKVEQSSRAFSAAEAGIEKALQPGGSTCGNNCVSFSGNNSRADVSGVGLIPAVPASGTQQVGLEYPPLGIEDVAQFWLADLEDSTNNPPTEFYMPGSKTCSPGTTCRGIEIYWGDPNAEKAAIAVKIIYYDSSAASYKTAAYYFDSDASRSVANGFTNSSTNCSASRPLIDTILGNGRSFYCREIILPTSTPAFPAFGLMLVRARLLYNSTSQPVAIRGYGICGKDCSLPSQARSITSTGVAGESQRKVKVFQMNKVVPPYFDFAIFSTGAIDK